MPRETPDISKMVLFENYRDFSIYVSMDGRFYLHRVSTDNTLVKSYYSLRQAKQEADAILTRSSPRNRPSVPVMLLYPTTGRMQSALFIGVSRKKGDPGFRFKSDTRGVEVFRAVAFSALHYRTDRPMVIPISKARAVKPHMEKLAALAEEAADLQARIKQERRALDKEIESTGEGYHLSAEYLNSDRDAIDKERRLLKALGLPHPSDKESK